MAHVISETDFNEALDCHYGWCESCHRIAGECVEPDAEGYKCDRCGAMAVTGIEMAVVAGTIEVE